MEYGGITRRGAERRGSYAIAERTSSTHGTTPTQHHGYSAQFAPEIIAYEVDQWSRGVGDLFRADAIDRRTEIIDYLKNVFYFFDKCPGLTVKVRAPRERAEQEQHGRRGESYYGREATTW
jgi:hypothetical protein